MATWLAGRRIHAGRWIFNIILVVLGAWLLWAGRDIWFPISIAFAIAMVLDPTVDKLEMRGMPRWLATTLVFVLFLGGSIALIVLLTPAVAAQAEIISQDLRKLFPNPDRPNLAPVAQEMMDRLNAHPALRDAVTELASEGTRRLASTLDAASRLLLAWVPNLIWLILIPVIAFYALIDFHKIYARIILLIPRQNRDVAEELIAEVSTILGQYLRGLTLICFLISVTASLTLFALGNKYWPLLGILAGPLYAIPAVGSIFNAGLALLVTSLAVGPAQGLITAGALILITNGIFDQVITPKILGKQVGVHPILTIVALTLGFHVAGILGMLVAVPLAATARAIALHLVPKLGIEINLPSVDELKQKESETRDVHLNHETKIRGEHALIKTAVQNAENEPDPEHEPRDWDLIDKEAEAARLARASGEMPSSWFERENDDWESLGPPRRDPPPE